MKTPEQLVDAFAKSMKFELAQNEHKGEWRDWDNKQAIFHELQYHKDKLETAMIVDDKKAIKEHLADCGNYLLMLGNAYKLYD